MRRFTLVFALALGVAGTGCSTAEPLRTGRMGMLEDLGRDGAPTQRAQRPSAEDEEHDAREERAAKALSDAKLEELRPVVAAWSLPLRSYSMTSSFGRRGRSFHEGIDLRARSGTAIHAVQDGRVIYASRKIKGYGKMVVIKHGAGLSTVYAHCSKLLVRSGQRVRRGQKLALSGNTGHSSGPHLHFEVRYGSAAVDPARLLAGVAAKPGDAQRHIAASE